MNSTFSPAVLNPRTQRMEVTKCLRDFRDDQEYLHVVREGIYDIGERVPSFSEFDGMRRREVADRFGIDWLTTYIYVNDGGLRYAWLRYVSGRFDRGAIVPNFVWGYLAANDRRAITHTLRGKVAGLNVQQPSVASTPKLMLNHRGDATLRVCRAP